MDRFVPRDDALAVIASEARQSIPAHHMDRFVPRDDALAVIASEARQSISEGQSIQRGNPYQRTTWIASYLAMTAHPSLRAKRGNP